MADPALEAATESTTGDHGQRQPYYGKRRERDLRQVTRSL